MNPREKQLIGIIASENEANGKNSVFINSNSAIQYIVKSLMSNVGTNEFFTGYMSSFEEDVDFDDEYLSDFERENKFRESVSDKLFVYSYRPSDGQFVKMSKVSVVPKPTGFNESDFYNAVPVFAGANDETIIDWESFKRWKLYRDYNSLDDFYETIKAQKSVGRIYGYDAEERAPSFVVWKDRDEKLFAIGRISGCHYNSLRGIILDSNNELFKIDISDYVKFIIYDVDINPTLTFIPESIYKEIEDRILKAEVAREKEIVEKKM